MHKKAVGLPFERMPVKEMQSTSKEYHGFYFILSKKYRWILTFSKRCAREEAFRNFLLLKSCKRAMFFWSLKLLVLVYTWKRVRGMENLIKLIIGRKAVGYFQAQYSIPSEGLDVQVVKVRQNKKIKPCQEQKKSNPQ